jgi:hypothetical protein
MDLQLQLAKTLILTAIQALASDYYDEAEVALKVIFEAHEIMQTKDYDRLTADVAIVLSNLKAGKKDVLS